MLGTRASRPPLMPRLGRLGSASDTRSRAGLRARPSSLTGYSPGLPGHVPPVDFCNCVDPQAQPRPLQTPPLVAVETTARWVAPLPEEHRQLGSHSSGVTPALSRPCYPHADLLRQRGFTPNRSTQTPLVARRCRQRPGIGSQTTTGRIPVPPTTPFETLGGSARPTRPDDRDAPFRAAFCAHSRKRSPLAAPKVPSTSSTPLSADHTFRLPT